MPRHPLSNEPRRYEVRGVVELQRHLGYMARALEHRAHFDLEVPGIAGLLIFTKQAFKTRPASLRLSLSFELQGREEVTKMAEALVREGIDHRRTTSKKRRLIRHLYLTWYAEDLLTPGAIVHVLRICTEALDLPFAGPFVFGNWGSFDESYTLRDDDPWPPSGLNRIAERLGTSLGSWSGRLSRWLGP